MPTSRPARCRNCRTPRRGVVESTGQTDEARRVLREARTRDAGQRRAARDADAPARRSVSLTARRLALADRLPRLSITLRCVDELCSCRGGASLSPLSLSDGAADADRPAGGAHRCHAEANRPARACQLRPSNCSGDADRRAAERVVDPARQRARPGRAGMRPVVTWCSQRLRATRRFTRSRCPDAREVLGESLPVAALVRLAERTAVAGGGQRRERRERPARASNSWAGSVDLARLRRSLRDQGDTPRERRRPVVTVRDQGRTGPDPSAADADASRIVRPVAAPAKLNLYPPCRRQTGRRISPARSRCSC